MIQNLLEYFDVTVGKVSGRTAVIDGDRTVSYGELADKARSLGTYLAVRLDGTVNRPIALFMEKSIECVYGDLGVMYSGNAYMNLDVNTPDNRIANIIKLVEPALILTVGRYTERLSAIFPAENIVDVETLTPGEADMPRLLSIRDRLIDTDPSCLINTSGSTGTPKSVVLNHRSFVDFTEWAIRTTGITDHEIIGSLSPVIFDIYSFELCMMMALGSTLVVLPAVMAAFPVKILQLMREKKVSYIFWVPTIMVNIANMDLIRRLPLEDLRNVWFAGEVFPTKQFNYWKRNIPDARFINLYGPIEITLDCTYFIVDRDIPDEEPLPIGFPCRNTDVLILNEENKPAAEGEEGELCVRGTSLAMGYYNNPEKTAAAFVQNPLQSAYPEIIYRTGDVVYRNSRNEIMFKGRKDNLVKHSGYRIDLGEIEHVAINVLKLVKNGCIVYDYKNKHIVFYYEPASDMSTTDMRKMLSEHLPHYMIPNVFTPMDELPRNPNGKIDRLKLKEQANG